jgi:hypothetical protein
MTLFNLCAVFKEHGNKCDCSALGSGVADAKDGKEATKEHIELPFLVPQN